MISTKVFLTPDLITRESVTSFHCGDNPWETEISDWLKSQNPEYSALEDMKNRGTKVWLYVADADVVGVGSLGTTPWKWPAPDGPRETIVLIPNLAVHSSHQRKGYGSSIMEDLLGEANEMGCSNIIGLMVDPQNSGAISLYEKYKFVVQPGKYGKYLRMARTINLPPDNES